MKLTIHLYLVPRLRMSGAILPFPLYGFEACKDSFIFAVTVYVYRSALRHDTLAVGGWKRSSSQSGRFNPGK